MKKGMFFIAIAICLSMPFKMYADGAFFFQGFTAQAENAQQAIVLYDTNTQKERLYLSVALSNANPTNACWIIATPGLPSFQDMKYFDIYSVLKYKSDPYLSQYNSSGYYSGYSYYPGCGCPFYYGLNELSTGTTTGSGGLDSGTLKTTLWYSITNSVYIASVISSTTTNIYDWLTNNGYKVDAAHKTVLNYYVAKNFYFTAIKLNDFKQKSTLFARLEFTTAAPIFPLYISSINSSDQQRLQIFYASQYRARTTNYQIMNVPISNIRYIKQKELTNDYSATLQEWDYYQQIDKKAALAEYNALFLEYAGTMTLSSMSYYYDLVTGTALSDARLDDVIREMSFLASPIWVTRFYTKLTPAQMRDIYFTPYIDPQSGKLTNISYSVYKEISISGAVTNVRYTRDYYLEMKHFVTGLSVSMAETGILIVPLAILVIRNRRKKS